jgi:hypothetical protein
MLARRKKAAAIRDLDSIQDSTRVSFWGKYSSKPQIIEKTENNTRYQPCLFKSIGIAKIGIGFMT